MESQVQTRIVFTLPIARSNRLCIYLLTLHLLMLVSVLSLLNHLLEITVVIVFMSCSLFYYLQRYYFLAHAKSLSTLHRDSDNNWGIIYSSNNASKPLLLTSSYVSQYCVILYFNGAGFWSKHSVFIMADAVDGELFRQLRVYCRDPKTFLK